MGNCAGHCGSSGHQNKGKSKKAIHKEITLLIEEKKPESERDTKDAENKSGTLEGQFCEASGWAANTGQGVTDPGDFEGAVRKRCHHHRELEPIMGERPNAEPLATSEEDESEEDLLFGNDEELDIPAEPPAAVGMAVNISAVPATPQSGVSCESMAVQSGNKRPSAAVPGKGKSSKGKQDVDNVLAGHFEGVDCHDLREREAQAKEKEASARMSEAAATTQKTEKETQLPSIQAKAALLRERKKPPEEGACTADELDQVLPLTQ